MLFRQCISMAVLLVFVGFQWFQFHHQHHVVDSVSSNSKITQLNQKCEVCEFVLSKESSCISTANLTAPAPLTFNIPAIVFLPYQLGKATTFAPYLDNKGPPTA